ncbi:class I SAM-dependent rRNA methyltransferase [Verrucomicrobiales bacterium]|jgi:23S rRNA (cytosine1962-C5)-methyltransferase|nr:class I SAM-dependent rRNA methyltransferase [Verrucomicrobiales bacterium]
MAGVVVKPRARIYHGHDWVYSSDIKKIFGDPSPGDIVSLKDFKDRPLGSGIYNPKSQIVVRRFSRQKQQLDVEFFKRRIQRAVDHRETLGLDMQAIRLVWSESDGLPGVIVDRYGDHLVLQTLTLAMDQRKTTIAEALQSVIKPKSITERNDSPIRGAEGLESVKGLLFGSTPEAFDLQIGGLIYQVDMLEGQKTGLYLDQLANHAAVAELSKDLRVLDVFSHQGGFALACRQAGAAEVTGIEISASAVAAAQINATRNDLKVNFVKANAFDHLRELESQKASFDLIILDPPSFTKNKGSLSGALRGYKEIHLRALKLLQPGGRLATFSCSHHINHETFTQMISGAAVDAKRTLRRLANYSQRADHPVIATLPETEYLRGFAYETMGGW